MLDIGSNGGLPQIPPPPPTLLSLAREALRDANNDVAAASAALCERLLNDEVLLRLLIEKAISDAAYMAVGHAIRNDRQSIQRDVSRAAGPALDGAATLNVLRRNFLDFPLAGGLLLGDATRADVLAQVDRYSSQADDMSHKARWLQRVAERTPGRKRVGQVMTAAVLEQLFEGAKA